MNSFPITSPQALSSQWRRLLPVGFALALSLAGDLTLYAVLPAYSARLAISLASVGVLLSANRLVRLVSNPLVGLLANRFSRRRLVLTGLATGVASTLLYILARGFALFLMGRLLWGISWSLIYIGAFLMMMDTLGEEERGWGSGLLQTFYFFGLAVTPLVGGLLSAWLGFSSALLVCAGIQFAALVEALLFLPETYRPAPESGDRPDLRAVLARLAGRVLAASGARSVSLHALRVRQLVARGNLLAAYYLYLLVLFAGDGIVMSTITLYLKQRFGETLSSGQTALSVASVGGALLALRAVVSAGAAPLAGIWSDRNGQRWSVAAWGALVAVGGCALLGLDGGFWLILLGVTLTAFGVAVVVTVLPAIVSTGTGRQGGLYLGLLNNAGDIGAAVAPLAGYLLLGSLSLGTLYLVTGGLLVTGIAAALVARRK